MSHFSSSSLPSWAAPKFKAIKQCQGRLGQTSGPWCLLPIGAAHWHAHLLCWPLAAGLCMVMLRCLYSHVAPSASTTIVLASLVLWHLRISSTIAMFCWVLRVSVKSAWGRVLLPQVSALPGPGHPGAAGFYTYHYFPLEPSIQYCSYCEMPLCSSLPVLLRREGNITLLDAKCRSLSELVVCAPVMHASRQPSYRMSCSLLQTPGLKQICYMHLWARRTETCLITGLQFHFLGIDNPKSCTHGHSTKQEK